MPKSSRVFRVGTRGSKLALTQTRFVLDRLATLLKCGFEEVPCSSPGDRDRETDLAESPDDFFCRDLDDAVLEGGIDLAVHSAKDLPEDPARGLDFVWLPWREDRRDVLVCRPGGTPDALPPGARIGVSSPRRIEFCRRFFPRCVFVSIRGNVEERIALLDAGDYDMIILAAAGLARLGLEGRISRYIPPADLETPEAQGVLAMTFRKNHPELSRIRKLFVKPLVFAGAGIGPGNITLEARNALETCDICLYDALLDPAVLKYLSPAAKAVPVGKRSGNHSVPQADINIMLSRYVRQGGRVVRLKGGDPGIFGRLAEEAEAMDDLDLPYRVLPGLSSFQTAAAEFGTLLTKRGVSRGFTVITPRREGGGRAEIGRDDREVLPLVIYMGTEKAMEICRTLMDEGRPGDAPAAALFGIGSPDGFIVRSTLAGLPAGILAARKSGSGGSAAALPGLIVVGAPAALAWKERGLLGGKRILVTAGDTLQDKAVRAVRDYGGTPVPLPLIELVREKEAAWAEELDLYDWVVLTSPSSVRFFLEVLRERRLDLRRIPRLIVPGRETERELERAGILADIVPDGDFSAASMLKAAFETAGVRGANSFAGARILRLRSDRASDLVAESLRSAGALVDDFVLYRNVPRKKEALPSFDAAFFASASAAEAFIGAWGVSALEGREVLAIGRPTESALRRLGVDRILVGPEATLDGAMAFLAAETLRRGFGLGKTD